MTVLLEWQMRNVVGLNFKCVLSEWQMCFVWMINCVAVWWLHLVWMTNVLCFNHKCVSSVLWCMQGDWRNSLKAEANGLVPGHAYTVTDVTKVSSFLLLSQAGANCLHQQRSVWWHQPLSLWSTYIATGHVHFEQIFVCWVVGVVGDWARESLPIWSQNKKGSVHFLKLEVAQILLKRDLKKIFHQFSFVVSSFLAVWWSALI